MASRGVNKVILIGNLGGDPEVRYTASGTAVAQLRLATTEVRKNRETGENQDHTEWHRVTCWARLAEIAGEYLKKGSKIYIEGRIQTRKWQDNSGQDRYTTEIIAGEMQMLDGRGDASKNYDAPKSSAKSSSANDVDNAVNADDFDDDIPF